jgi:hypothetical protein
MLHLKNQQYINIPFFFMKIIYRMATIAQRRLEFDNILYHHGLVNMLSLSELRETGWDWDIIMIDRVINKKPRARVLSPFVH